jgi:hypothetical protein
MPPIIEPIYSIEKGAEVYHNNSECTERNNIETRNVRAGTGNKRICEHCQRLNNLEKYQIPLSLGLFGNSGNSILNVMKTKK